MRTFLISSVLLLNLLSSCTPKEEEEGIDYDNMVMLEEEEEWTTGLESGSIAGDLVPYPQEVVILETPEPIQGQAPASAVK